MNAHLIKRCCFMLFLGSQLSLAAQYEDILKRKEVTWVAEYTTDYVMNPMNIIHPDFSTDNPNYIELISLRDEEPENGIYGRLIDPGMYLNRQLLENVRDKNVTSYADASCSKTLSKEELMSRLVRYDTITDCEHCRYEGPHVVMNEIGSDSILFIRIRQVFWYDAKKKKFGARLLAYAPVAFSHGKEGKRNGTTALFWLKAGSQVDQASAQSAASYAFQTKMNYNAFPCSTFPAKKGKLDLRQWVSKELDHPSHALLEMSEYKAVDPSKILAECVRQDTIVEFEYGTYKEKIQFVDVNCMDWLENMGFVQNWYYDRKKRQLLMYLTGARPLLSIRGEGGYLRYYRPMFYQMYRN